MWIVNVYIALYVPLCIEYLLICVICVLFCGLDKL